jgi:hypothetical protein
MPKRGPAAKYKKSGPPRPEILDQIAGVLPTALQDAKVGSSSKEQEERAANVAYRLLRNVFGRN